MSDNESSLPNQESPLAPLSQTDIQEEEEHSSTRGTLAFPPSPCTLLSLPPELLIEIFTAIPRHPSRKRNSTLASLCLVNRLCLDLARPILYHEVHCDLKIDYNEVDGALYRLCRTLLEAEFCSGLVKSFKVTLTWALLSDIAILDYVLSKLEVERIRTSWWVPREEEEQADAVIIAEFVKVVLRHGQRIKSLEIPQVPIPLSEMSHTLASLPILETFSGIVPAPSSSAVKMSPIQSRLRSLTFSSPTNDLVLAPLISASYKTLTKLSLSIGPEPGKLDLSDLRSLLTLRILIEDPYETLFRYSTAVTSRMLKRRDVFFSELRQILASALALPITSYTLATERVKIGKVSRRYTLFDLLPPTLKVLSIDVTMLNGVETKNRDILSARLKGDYFPSLRTISLLPAVEDAPFSTERDAPGLARMRKVLGPILLEKGVTLEVRIGKENELHSGSFLDPECTDSEPEEDCNCSHH